MMRKLSLPLIKAERDSLADGGIKHDNIPSEVWSRLLCTSYRRKGRTIGKINISSSGNLTERQHVATKNAAACRTLSEESTNNLAYF
jgi:hypothetical protein